QTLKDNLELSEDDIKLIEKSLKVVYATAYHVSQNKEIFGEGNSREILSLLMDLHTKLEELERDENFYKITEIKIIKNSNKITKLLAK
ncbi:MAG: hypothetical protein AABY14_00590, partial [Nanoarchaeota archaeon]